MIFQYSRSAVEDSPRWTRLRDENGECSCFFAYGWCTMRPPFPNLTFFLDAARSIDRKKRQLCFQPLQ